MGSARLVADGALDDLESAVQPALLHVRLYWGMMDTFWLLVMSHVGCFLAGVLIARNPEQAKARISAFGNWLVGLLPKKKG